MTRIYTYDYDDYYDDYYDPWEEEERERRAHNAECERIQGLTPEQLAEEWWRQCRRHDFAVDRCEEINSPTIEDAQMWMNYIDREFVRRELNRRDFL